MECPSTRASGCGGSSYCRGGIFWLNATGAAAGVGGGAGALPTRPARRAAVEGLCGAWDPALCSRGRGSLQDSQLFCVLQNRCLVASAVLAWPPDTEMGTCTPPCWDQFPGYLRGLPHTSINQSVFGVCEAFSPSLGGPSRLGWPWSSRVSWTSECP